MLSNMTQPAKNLALKMSHCGRMWTVDQNRSRVSALLSEVASGSAPLHSFFLTTIFQPSRGLQWRVILI